MDQKSYYNKKARFNYDIKDSFEMGVVLTGDEIKGIRSGRIDMSTSYVKLIGGEVFWIGGSILTVSGEEPQRTRKLLAHKSQIQSLSSKIEEKGMTLLPLKLYFKKGKVKMEVGLGRGKKKYEKKDVLRKRDQDREVEQKLKQF